MGKLKHDAETYQRRALDQLRKARKNLERAKRQAKIRGDANLYGAMETAEAHARKGWKAAAQGGGS